MFSRKLCPAMHSLVLIKENKLYPKPHFFLKNVMDKQNMTHAHMQRLLY